LLSFQIPKLSWAMKTVLKNGRHELSGSSVPASKLAQTYGAIAATLIDSEYRLDWFVSEIFTKDEIAE
jgi:hypothetical protein